MGGGGGAHDQHCTNLSAGLNQTIPLVGPDQAAHRWQTIRLCQLHEHNEQRVPTDTLEQMAAFPRHPSLESLMSIPLNQTHETHSTQQEWWRFVQSQ